MSKKTILVIDDSATIRKLVDTHLGPDGYEVVLAANAEDGLKLAEQVQPDLILLDHQLPGTTGYEVCRQLIAAPSLRQIPVVVSSTLRKRAYAEYTDCDNVVDMLPKPYTEELLRTTVANALETAAMVVASQSGGTAVPEVISAVGEADLGGSFAGFSLREVLDFLNNGGKRGTLAVEAERTRWWFYLDGGRIQGVSATGIGERETSWIARALPASLENLAPVLQLTIGGRSCAEVDGFVQLLDRKVLDPRLMTKLLIYQAAMLVRLAFTQKLTAFRFESGQAPPQLHRNLPLDASLLALLVEGALHAEGPAWEADGGDRLYTRRAIRGQNLDRAGLSARHMKIVNLLSEPRSAEELASQLGWDREEVMRVLHGFMLADLAESHAQTAVGKFIVYEPDPATAQHVRAILHERTDRYVGKVVRDRLALQLVLKRTRPDALVFAADSEAACACVREVFASAGDACAQVKRIAVMETGDGDADRWRATLGFSPDETIARPYTADSLFRRLDRLFQHPSNDAAEPNASADAPSQPTVAEAAEAVAAGNP